ncbi:MAG: hypothetical protein A2882_05210 [Phenylobacterium sp. RIFCSPHIGHO2_01_FULL_70_10]|nr:MAG: hypothetical protein A2882_05210 [Phenylobacterium sp. RIFCSPHIGHO2_01_FULL_70_10]
MIGWIALSRAAIAPQLRAWRGQAPLAEVFWIHGVVHSLTLALILLATIQAGLPWATAALLLLLVPYTAFAVVAIWRCAETGASGGDWAVIAQALSIAWMANVLLLSGAAAFSLLA